jgi:hypothetical protein
LRGLDALQSQDEDYLVELSGSLVLDDTSFGVAEDKSRTFETHCSETVEVQASGLRKISNFDVALEDEEE